MPAPAGYLKAARAACDAAGRCSCSTRSRAASGGPERGSPSRPRGSCPTCITLAKGLGGGLPIGACIGIGAAGSGLGKGDHGSTFGGNPVACAAALAVLDTIERDGLLGHVTQVGAALTAGNHGHRPSADRGRPRQRAVAGHRAHRAGGGVVETAARQAGFLVNAVQPDAVRLAPPLVLSADQARSFTDALPGILSRASMLAGPET